MGARLSHSAVIFGKRCPTLFSAKHRFIKLLFLRKDIRGKYWPLGGRSLAKMIVRNCTKSYGRSSIWSYKTKPFFTTYITATSFTDSLLNKNRKGKRSKKSKWRTCIFMYFSIFCQNRYQQIDGVRRFGCRRGIPLNIYSDNCSNFIIKNYINFLH